MGGTRSSNLARLAVQFWSWALEKGGQAHCRQGKHHSRSDVLITQRLDRQDAQSMYVQQKLRSISYGAPWKWICSVPQGCQLSFRGFIVYSLKSLDITNLVSNSSQNVRGLSKMPSTSTRSSVGNSQCRSITDTILTKLITWLVSGDPALIKVKLNSSCWLPEGRVSTRTMTLHEVRTMVPQPCLSHFGLYKGYSLLFSNPIPLGTQLQVTKHVQISNVFCLPKDRWLQYR